MDLYVTTQELKDYLGISGSAQDTVLAMLNKQATAALNQMLGSSNLALHKVTGELHDGRGQKLRLFDVHPVAVGDITCDGDAYTQDDEYDIDQAAGIVRLEKWLWGGDRKASVDYAAGWNAGGYATIEILNYAGITTETVTVTPNGGSAVVATAGSTWTVGASNAAAAASLAARLDTAVGLRAFALGAVVYVVDETPQRESSTIATTLGASLATLSGATLAGVDFPEDLRHAVFLLVSGMLARRKQAKVKSYTIGSKTVTFGSDEEANELRAIVAGRAKPFVIGTGTEAL